MDEEKRADLAKVKNKQIAPIQITAEQLLQEATARLSSTAATSEKGRARAAQLADRRDIGEYRERQRKTFEDNLRRNRSAIGVWIKYAAWEQNQHDLARARSIYERALDVDGGRSAPLWLRYAEMEMRAGHVNMARNLWNRAVTIHPRVAQFWYKYAYMEEQAGNIGAAAEVWERWMVWQPEAATWWTYVKFALRHKQLELARSIMERLLTVHPRDPDSWTKVAKALSSEPFLDIDAARSVFERGLDALNCHPTLAIEFARWEVTHQEVERARAIYGLALEANPKSAGLLHSFAQFERAHGEAADGSTPSALMVKRKNDYETHLSREPFDYDTWFSLLSLLIENSSSSRDVIRETFERAIGNVPPVVEKRHWRRYIFLWLYYAIHEELVASDLERTEAVLKGLLALIPHAQFTSGRAWKALGQFYLRHGRLDAYRKIMGIALGKCPKRSILRQYISWECSLREFDRARSLYAKWIQLAPSETTVYCQWAELEAALEERDRAKAILGIPISAPQAFDQPELAWKTLIDLQEEWGESVQETYEQLLAKSGGHVRVYLAYASYLYNNGSIDAGRAVLEKAFRELPKDEDRLTLLEAWLLLEQQQPKHDNSFIQEKLLKRYPKRIKRDKRWILVFPSDTAIAEDEATASVTTRVSLKLLEMAHQWKTRQANE